jgi:hypothetical protein
MIQPSVEMFSSGKKLPKIVESREEPLKICLRGLGRRDVLIRPPLDRMFHGAVILHLFVLKFIHVSQFLPSLFLLFLSQKLKTSV